LFFAGDMRVNKSLNDPWPHSGNQAERFANTTDFFCNAIENAGGVPFQLIFGFSTLLSPITHKVD
jgi:hypothetical protein